MAEPLRILHVFGGLERGGSETMIMNMYRHLDREKLQFDFIVCNSEKGAFPDEIEALGGRIFRMPRFQPPTLVRFRLAFEEFFRANPDYRIIHGHLRSSASVYLGIARRHGLVTIAHSHSTSSGRGLKAAVKDLLQKGIVRSADYLIACSDAAGRWLFGDAAVAKENYFVLNNAVDTDAFAFNEQNRRRIRSELSCADNFVVGHIGSFNAVKNHGFIIELFEELRRREGRAKLLLVGDGSLRAEVTARIRDRGLGDDVILTGTRQDIPELLSAMDVFILPSVWEGLPVTAVEAQASGLRCFLSDAVTREVSLTGLVRFLPLKDGAAVWAEAILPSAAGYARVNTAHAVREAGYDIRDTTARMQEFYLKALDAQRR